MSTVKYYLIGIIRAIITYSLCVSLNAFICIGFGIAFIFSQKIRNRFWKIYENPNINNDNQIPPKCLTDSKYGEHKYVTVNNIKLHYVEKGDSNKPLMLFIHGFPEFWYSWRYQIEEFSADYCTIAIDLRGYGNSSKPNGLSPYRLQNIIDDIEAFLNAINRRTCILVCHDWGAVIGWEFIKQHSDRITKYIMMGAPSSEVWSKSVAKDRVQMLKSYYVYIFQMPIIPEYILKFVDFNTLINLYYPTRGWTKDDSDAFAYIYNHPDSFTHPLNYYRANLRFFRPPERPVPSSIGRIRGLFALGENDIYISLKTGPEMQKKFKNLHFEIVKGANHFLHQDAADDTNKLIRNFLNEK